MADRTKSLRWSSVVLGAFCIVGIPSACDFGGDNASGAAANGLPNADAGSLAPSVDLPCKLTSDCSSNTICHYANASEPMGVCTLPSGDCTGPADAVELTGSCYFGARCELQAPGAGHCVFTPASHAVFPSASTGIPLDSPTDSTSLTSVDGFSLQWEPPTGQPAGAVTVAVITDAIPVLDPGTNEINNPSAVRWIWSSSDPGGAVQQGSVAIQYGARGLTPTGELSPTRWGTDSLPDGVYWWFVYEIVNGNVSLSSVIQRFRVGTDQNPAHTCDATHGASDCVEAGYAPETAACVNRQCMQRCASNLDCPAVGSHCDFSVVIQEGSNGQDRHSGFCQATSAM